MLIDLEIESVSIVKVYTMLGLELWYIILCDDDSKS